MNSPACGLRLVSIFAGLGCLVHLVRLFVRFQIVINNVTVPVWFGGVAFVVLGLLSFWFWKLSRDATPPHFNATIQGGTVSVGRSNGRSSCTRKSERATA